MVMGLAIFALALLLPGSQRWSSLTYTTEIDCSIPIPLEMRDRHEYLTPFLKGEAYLDKPPLYWWMILASYKIFGVSLFALRLPAFLCTAGTVAATALLGETLGLTMAGCLGSGLLALSSVGLFGEGRISIIDIGVTFLTVVSFCGLARWLLERRRSGLYLCALSSGLSMMCKWPVAPVVLGLALVLWFLWERDWSPLRTMKWHLVGAALLILAVLLPWNLAMVWRYPVDYWKKVFVAEFFYARFITNANVPISSFLLMCLLAFAPWTLLSLATIFVPKKAAPGFPREDRLLLVFIAASILPFVIQKLKAERYVLFLIPLLTLWTLRHFDMSILWHKLAARLTSVLILLTAMGVCGLGLWFRLGVGASGLALLCGVVAAWGLWHQGNMALAGGGFSGVLLVVLGLFLPKLGPGDFPVQETLRSIPGPISIFCRAHDMGYFPLFAGRSSRNLEDFSGLRLALSRGHSLATCEEDMPKLQAFLQAMGGATYQTQAQWPYVTLSHARWDQIKTALQERSLAIFAHTTYILTNFSSPGRFFPQGIKITDPMKDFHIAPGGYLAYLAVECPGIDTASRVEHIGRVNLLNKTGDIHIGGAFFKIDILPSKPYWFVWPLLINKPDTLRVSMGAYGTNPPLETAGLWLQPAPPDAIRKLLTQ